LREAELKKREAALNNGQKNTNNPAAGQKDTTKPNKMHSSLSLMMNGVGAQGDKE